MNYSRVLRSALLFLSGDFKDYGIPTGHWVEFTREEIRSDDGLAAELVLLINKAYESAPGGRHLEINDVPSLRASDVGIFLAVDADGDDIPDATILRKETSNGIKDVASGQNGTNAAKRAMLTRKIADLKDPTSGVYVEVSAGMARRLLDSGVPVVEDESLVRSVLRGKELEWHGNHPTGEFPQFGWYTRNIQGHPETKIMVGHPRS
jgi:hypothetical protein